MADKEKFYDDLRIINLYPFNAKSTILCSSTYILYCLLKIEVKIKSQIIAWIVWLNLACRKAYWPRVGGGGLKYPRHVSSLSQLLVIKTRLRVVDLIKFYFS